MIHEGQFNSISRARLGPDLAKSDRQFARAHKAKQATRTRTGSPVPLIVSAAFFLALMSVCFVVAVNLWNPASWLFLGMGCLALWGAFECVGEATR